MLSVSVQPLEMSCTEPVLALGPPSADLNSYVGFRKVKFVVYPILCIGEFLLGLGGLGLPQLPVSNLI